MIPWQEWRQINERIGNSFYIELTDDVQLPILSIVWNTVRNVTLNGIFITVWQDVYVQAHT